MSKTSQIEFRIVNLGETERFRFDSEFYQNDYLALQANLNSLSTECLGDISIIRSGTTPKDRDDELTEGVNLLKTTDIRNVPLLKNRSYYKISEVTAQSMSSTTLKSKDILINIVGATLDVVGRVAFVPEDFEVSNITQAMALIRVTDERFLPEYIFAFLLSAVGNKQARRLARPTGQYNLNLPEVSAIRVPIVPMEKQLEIAAKLDQIERAYRDADSILKEASDSIAKELELLDFVFDETKFSVRNSVDVLNEHRIDSEYWQRGFDEIVAIVKRYPAGYSTVGSKFKQVPKKFKSTPDSEYLYVEISDLDVKSGEISPNLVLARDLPANAKIELLEKSLLVSKVRPNRGAIAIADNLGGAVVSGALVTLTPTSDLNLESLMMYLRLKPIRELMLKFNTGTSYPTITDEVIMALPVPNFPSELQKKIQNLLKESKELNRYAQLSLVELVSSI